jgi:radical SAM protein with 4Fe4S-binding SPASM domain
LDALIVTLGGITQETNEISRAGGSLERVLEGVRNIVAGKLERRSETPWISLTFIAMEYNEHEIPRLREVAQSLGVNMVNVKKMNPSSTQFVCGERDRMLPAEERLQRFAYDETGRFRLRVKRNPCKVLWHCPTIRWDGRINACAYDFHGDYHMGDLAEGTLRKFWLGKRYREMRRKFREDWEQLPICSRCTYAYEGGNYRDVFAESHVFDAQG